MAGILQLRTKLSRLRRRRGPIQSRHRRSGPRGHRSDGAAGFRVREPGRAVPRPRDDGNQHGDGDRGVGRPSGRPADVRVEQPAAEQARKFPAVTRCWLADGSGHSEIRGFVCGIAHISRWEAGCCFDVCIQWRGEAATEASCLRGDAKRELMS